MMSDGTNGAAGQQIAANAPLTGIVAVEIGTSVAGPFAGHVLADLGATVIKIENPDGGDDARRWGPPFWKGESVIFQVLNRNKKSAVIDMKDGDAIGNLRRFVIDHADIVLQNMRPGLVARHGVGPELRAEKPALIYCNMGAFGAVGPLSRRPGYDPLMQAFGGIMSMTGEEGRPPVRVGPSLVDVGTAMWSIIGLLAALRRRDLTGEGCEIDTSLFETALSWVNTHASGYLATGRVPHRRGSENPSLAPFKVFEASDGHILIAAGNDQLFVRLCQALGREDWPADPRFATNPDRVANREALNEAIQVIVATRTAQDWVEALEEVSVPCAPLQTMDQVIAHPQTKALDMFHCPAGGDLPLMSLPLSFDGQRPTIRTAAPELGADSGLLTGPEAGAAAPDA